MSRRGADPRHARLVVVATTPDGPPTPTALTSADPRRIVLLVDEHGDLREPSDDAAPASTLSAVPVAKHAAVAASLGRRLHGPHVALGMDRVAERALWDLAVERDDLVVVSSAEVAGRVLGLLAEGRPAADLWDGAGAALDILPGAGPTPVRVAGGRRQAPRPAWWPPRPWLELRHTELVVRPGRTAPGEAAVIRSQVRRGRPGAAAPSTSLLVGPANPAGQGHAIARVVARRAGWSTTSLDVHAAGTPVQWADVPVPEDAWRRASVRLRLAARLLMSATHVLFDGARPLVSVDEPGAADPRSLESWWRDVDALARSGRRVGLLLGPDDVAAQWGERLARLVQDVPGPVLVSSGALREVVPGATWLPPAVPDWAFRLDADEVLTRARPVVAVSGWTEGSGVGPPGLDQLAAEGLVELRNADAVPPLVRRHLLAGADVLVEREPTGAALEALAGGRLVVAGGGAAVVPGAPLIVDPDVAGVVREVVARPEDHRDRARRGASFAREVLDGRRTADLLLAAWAEVGGGVSRRR